MSTCAIYHLYDLDSIALNIKNTVHNLSSKYLRQLRNGYINDVEYEAKLKDKVDRLITYGDVIQRVRDQSISGNALCLNRSSIQDLVEKIKRIVGKNCRNELCDIKVDNSKEAEWTVKNPYCRSYEDWDKWTKFLCGELQLEIEATTEVKSNLVLEITKEIISPNVLLALSAVTEVRDNYTLEISRSGDEVNLDFSLLLEGYPNCDLCAVDYAFLIQDLRLSFDIVKTIYDEGLSLVVKDNRAFLKTPLGKYPLDKISGKINPSYLKRFGMKPTIDKKDLLQDYK